MIALRARVSDSFMYSLLMDYQITLFRFLMATDITAVLFILVIEFVVNNFHNFVRYSLIASSEYVYLIDATDGLII